MGRSENNEMIKPIKISILGKLNKLRTSSKVKISSNPMGNKKHKCHIFLTRHLFIEIWDDSLITDENAERYFEYQTSFRYQAEDYY